MNTQCYFLPLFTLVLFWQSTNAWDEPFNQKDLYDEINKLAQSINVDIDTLENTLTSNGIRYETLIDYLPYRF